MSYFSYFWNSFCIDNIVLKMFIMFFKLFSSDDFSPTHCLNKQLFYLRKCKKEICYSSLFILG